MQRAVNDSQTSSATVSKSSAELEKAIICGVLRDAGALPDAIEAGLKDSDFSVEANRVIWQAIIRQHERGEAIDRTTVLAKLEAHGALARAGGAARLADIERLLASSAHVEAYARLLIEEAKYRRIAEGARLILKSAYRREFPADELLAQAQSLFISLNVRAAATVTVDRVGTVDRVLGSIGKPAPGALSSGWESFDAQMRGGLRPGALYVVAARPAMGKSAFAHQLACRIADGGKAVAFFSLEMSDTELVEREIACESGVAVPGWINRHLTSRVFSAADRVRARRLMLIDRAGLDIATVCSVSRRLVAQQSVELIVIDYLQLIRASERYRGDKVNETAEISRSLKELASDLRIPIVALSQLNREVEKRPDKRPSLSDLRDSGAIEQDANCVMFLHRPEYYLRDRTPPEQEGLCEVIIAKSRNGPTGVLHFTFDGPTTRFTDRGTNDAPII